MAKTNDYGREVENRNHRICNQYSQWRAFSTVFLDLTVGATENHSRGVIGGFTVNAKQWRTVSRIIPPGELFEGELNFSKSATKGELSEGGLMEVIR